MSKASQSILIIASLILLMGAGGCGLKLVAQPGGSGVNNSTNSTPTTSQQLGGRELANKWITDNSPTYKFDGENLVFMQSVASRCADGTMLYEFTFDSRNGGYGNRVNEALDGVKTAHTIRVTVKDSQIISAVTDNRYDELTGRFGDLSTDTEAETVERC